MDRPTIKKCKAKATYYKDRRSKMQTPGQSNPLAANKSEKRGEERTSLEESKTAEAVLADRLSVTSVEDVDEHVFFRVSRKEA